MKIINMMDYTLVVKGANHSDDPLVVEPSGFTVTVGECPEEVEETSGIMLYKYVSRFACVWDCEFEETELPEEAEGTLIVVSDEAYRALQDGGYLEARNDVYSPMVGEVVGHCIECVGLMQGKRR